MCPSRNFNDVTAQNYNPRVVLSRVTEAGEQPVKVATTSSSLYGNVTDVTPAEIPIVVDQYITNYRISRTGFRFRRFILMDSTARSRLPMYPPLRSAGRKASYPRLHQNCYCITIYPRFQPQAATPCKRHLRCTIWISTTTNWTPDCWSQPVAACCCGPSVVEQKLYPEKTLPPQPKPH